MPSPSLSTFPSFSLPLPSFPLPPSPFPGLRFSLLFCFFPPAFLLPPIPTLSPFPSRLFSYLLFEVARAGRPGPSPSLYTVPSFSLPLPSFRLPPSPFLLSPCLPPSPFPHPFSVPFPSLPLLCIRFYLLFEVARAWKTRTFPFPFHLSFLPFTFTFLSFTSVPLPPSQIFPSLLLLSLCLPPSTHSPPFLLSLPFSSSSLPFFGIFYLKWLGPGRPVPSPSLSTFPSFSLPLPSFPLPPSPFPGLRFSLPFCFFPPAFLLPPFPTLSPFPSLLFFFFAFFASSI